jgi:hypothetical protein
MVNFIISSAATTLNLQRLRPHCGRNNGNIHSAIRRRRINDTKTNYVVQRRMNCPHCRTTWTIRAEDASDGRQRIVPSLPLKCVLLLKGCYVSSNLKIPTQSLGQLPCEFELDFLATAVIIIINVRFKPKFHFFFSRK